MEELVKTSPCAAALATGPSTHEIKHERRHAQVKFCRCQRAGTEFKTCGLCKTVFYCSRQCQKDDWPEHKKECRPPDSDSHKLLQIFTANKYTKLQLQFALIVEFDLINKPMDFSRPSFDALMDMVMLPINESDTLDLMDATKNQELQDVEIEGMIQLWNIRPFAREWDELDRGNHTMWKLTYDIHPIDDAMRQPTGFIRFRDIASDEEGERKILTHLLSISPLTIDMMRFAKTYKFSTNKGDMEIPMASEMILQFINEAIAFDTSNTWMLRKKLRACDKALLLDPDISSEIKRKMKSKEQIMKSKEEKKYGTETRSSRSIVVSMTYAFFPPAIVQSGPFEAQEIDHFIQVEASQRF